MVQCKNGCETVLCPKDGIQVHILRRLSMKANIDGKLNVKFNNHFPKND